MPSGGADNDWVGAIVNRPLTTGDKLWADTDGRSELHIGSTAIRMDHNTGLSFLNLDDATVQIRLSDGVMTMKVRSIPQGDSYEIDTPNLAFSIQQPGFYNIETHPDNNVTIVTVREGAGEVTGGGRSWQVISDQQAVFTGTDTLDYDLKDADAQATTDFDRWAMTRDAREDHVIASDHNVSPDMTGYEDLDANGRWEDVPDYGRVWVPSNVAADWEPYRYGHWVWVAPWGWTWVEDEAWGFAPFHYGRWAFLIGLGLGPGTRCSAARLCTRLGRVGRRRWRLWRLGGYRCRRGLVPARAARSVCSRLSRKRAVRHKRQHFQYGGEPNHGRERVQQSRLKRHLRESQRHNRGFA